MTVTAPEINENDKKLLQSFLSNPEKAIEARHTMESFAKLMAYYKCAMMEVETKFNVLNEEFFLQYDRNPISSIKSRLKRLDSIIHKMQRDSSPLTLASVEENLNDVAGVRVICSFTDDVYMLADALLSQDDVTLIKKRITYKIRKKTDTEACI